MATLHRDSWEQYAAIMQAEAAEMKAEIGRMRLAIADIADPTLTADECRSIARETLGWETSATADEEQG